MIAIMVIIEIKILDESKNRRLLPKMFKEKVVNYSIKMKQKL